MVARHFTALIPDSAARMLEEQRLGYVATVSEDNTPNLSPKGTILALDSHNIAFADIRSPQTIRNIRTNSAVEINVVDPISRRGYRFKGTAIVLTEGKKFADMLEMYRKRRIQSAIRSIVVVRVDFVAEITSPLYDLGFTESEVRERWKNRLS